MGFLDFNFYTGDNPPHEVSLMDKTLPTVIGLFLGFGLNRGYEYLRERRMIKRAGQEFINEIHLFVEPLEKQLISLKSAIDQLKDPHIRSFILESNIPVDKDRLKAIDRLHVYKYFLLKFKNNVKESRRIVNKLYGIHLVCSSEAEKMKDLLTTFNDDKEEDAVRINNALNGLMGAFAAVVLEIEKAKIDPKTDKFYLALKPFFDKFEQVNEKNPQEIIPEYCVPLINVCAENRFDDRSELFSVHLRDCYAGYRDYMAVHGNFIFQLEHIRNILFSQAKDIKSLLALPELVLYD